MKMEDSNTWDLNNSHNFVGRSSDFVELDRQWPVCRIFGIYGIRAVGKSTFVRLFLSQKGIVPVYFNLATVKDAASLVTIVCSGLGLRLDRPSVDSSEWIRLVTREVKQRNNNTSLTLLFDNTEDVVELDFKDAFLSLITNVVKQCSNVKVVITSTTWSQFSQLGKIFFLHELKPLLQNETLELLHSLVPDGLESYDSVIAELSEGLPLLITMVGTWLHEGLISPSELVDVLLVSRLISHIDGTCLSPENTVGVVYRKFIERLSELYLDYMTTLDYIPGSFTAQQAGEILSIPSVAYAKQFALKPIRKRSMLMYDSSCQRFDIQGILREVLRANYTIKDLPG